MTGPQPKALSPYNPNFDQTEELDKTEINDKSYFTGHQDDVNHEYQIRKLE